MAIDFLAATARLKEVLGVAADKDVAAALGLGDRAFAARKARGAFPEDKLLALVSRRPELRLDAHYVLTGERGSPHAQPVAGADVVSEIKQSRGAYAPPLNARLLADAMAAVEDALQARGVALDVAARAKLVSGVYEMSLSAGRVNPALVQPLLTMLL